MLANARSWSNRLGIASISFCSLFWAYNEYLFRWSAFARSPYIQFALMPGILVAAALTAIIAAVLGSKWWFLALLGPAAGALLMLGAGT